MKLGIGEKIICKKKDRDGIFFVGEIVDIWRNREETIAGYSAAFDSVNYVNIVPHYLKAVVLN